MGWGVSVCLLGGERGITSEDQARTLRQVRDLLLVTSPRHLDVLLVKVAALTVHEKNLGGVLATGERGASGPDLLTQIGRASCRERV